MQPTIVISSPDAGMIYLNGRFAGEASAQRPLIAPVTPSGALYLEYRPLEGDGLPLARRIVFAGGEVLPDSLADASGLTAVAWPNGVLELELSAVPSSSTAFLLEGLPCALSRGEETLLTLNGLEISLPQGALMPRLFRPGGVPALTGDIEGGGSYLVTLAPDLSARTGLLVADRIDFVSGDMLNAIVSLDDGVGHGRLEQWLVDAGGLHCASSEPVWSAGAPRWPETAEATMRAAVEAALAGLKSEAEGYLSPALAANRPLDAIAEVCEVCAPMKYAPPDPRPCVALIQAEGPRLARARPLYYGAEPSGGRQGPWRITSLGLE
ncbi:MAG: hypothetical protein Q4C10_14875 [Clostridia bacterium]|nr:hypothetical protein [Clostridia bacterium]